MTFSLLPNIPTLPGHQKPRAALQFQELIIILRCDDIYMFGPFQGCDLWGVVVVVVRNCIYLLSVKKMEESRFGGLALLRKEI